MIELMNLNEWINIIMRINELESKLMNSNAWIMDLFELMNEFHSYCLCGLSRHVFDEGMDDYKVITLNRRYLSFRVIKVRPSSLTYHSHPVYLLLTCLLTYLLISQCLVQFTSLRIRYTLHYSSKDMSYSFILGHSKISNLILLQIFIFIFPFSWRI